MCPLIPGRNRSSLDSSTRFGQSHHDRTLRYEAEPFYSTALCTRPSGISSLRN
ncbi:kelch repeat and BTB domain-containing protein 3 [Prionailurus iriomotensis]